VVVLLGVDDSDGVPVWLGLCEVVSDAVPLALGLDVDVRVRVCEGEPVLLGVLVAVCVRVCVFDRVRDCVWLRLPLCV